MNVSDTGKEFLEHVVFKTDQRKKLADQGEAMPDGSYPIRNVADLKRAIQAFGRSADKVKTKRWIIKRAKELDAVDLLPDDWKEAMSQSAVLGEEFLDHHGVKGMKWGVRKRRNEASRAKMFGGGKTRFKDAKAKDLTEEEINRRIRRLELEKKYNDLNKGQVKAGKDYASGILNNSGKSAAAAAVGTSVSFLVARALKKQFGS